MSEIRKISPMKDFIGPYGQQIFVKDKVSKQFSSMYWDIKSNMRKRTPVDRINQYLDSKNFEKPIIKVEYELYEDTHTCFVGNCRKYLNRN